jgi:hypothetical protein
MPHISKETRIKVNQEEIKELVLLGALKKYSKLDLIPSNVRVELHVATGTVGFGMDERTVEVVLGEIICLEQVEDQE